MNIWVKLNLVLLIFNLGFFIGGNFSSLYGIIASGFAALVCYDWEEEKPKKCCKGEKCEKKV